MHDVNHTSPGTFCWTDPLPTGAIGWVVIDSLVNGISAGGLFMHPEATLEEVADLAQTMSYKNTLLEPVIGGAKAGIRFNPQDPQAKDILRRFLFDHKSLLENCWYTGADLNTNNDFIFDVIERELKLPSAFYCLGNMLNRHFDIPYQYALLRSRLSLAVGNRFDLQSAATGYSVAMAVQLLSNHFTKIKPRVLIQGFGAVGSTLSYFLNIYNIATIVGIADVHGFISDPRGILIETVLAFTEKQQTQYRWSARLANETDEDFLCRFLSAQSADIFSPCATRYQVTPKVADVLMNTTFKDTSLSSRFIISGANNAFSTASVRQALEKKEVQVLPEWVSNAGTTILFMESMKAIDSNSNFVEHVFNVIRTQLKTFMDRHITRKEPKHSTLYDHCSAIAERRIWDASKLPAPALLPDIILSHVKNQPQAVAFTMLNGNTQIYMTFAELHHGACYFANILAEKNFKENNVILLFPSGLDFIVTFLACLYSGAIAVPLSFDKTQMHHYLTLIRKIIQDADVRAIATTENLAQLLKKELFIQEQKIDIIIIDRRQCDNKANTFKPISVSGNSISHIQYTSGSTSSPKGIICTHQNLSSSLFETAKVWHYTSKSITVCWAPHTHVYGLTTGLLVPLYSGSHAILMQPQDFLMNPALWLQTISMFKATHSGSPNFGYEFCAEHIDETELDRLDLSTWTVATNGGESVRYSTLIKFFNKFKRYGFKLNSFYPVYGMSECMGLITTPKMDKPFSFCYLDKEALKRNRVITFGSIIEAENANCKTQTFISCGFPIHGLEIKIVDPKTAAELTSNHIGEIWLSGPMCSPKHIKTGDLGFINSQGLFIVGRLKELIIIYGKNYYPIDIEMDIRNASSELSKYPCIAFSECIDDNEELFILQESETLSEQRYQELVQLLRKTVTYHHGIDVYGVVLVPLKSIPKTGSGKIQRNLAKQQYFDQKCQVLYESVKTVV